MHILNIMLGKGRGGLEQVAIDYHQAFELVGHRITSLVPPDSWAMDIFQTFTEETRSLSNMGEWDPIATFKLSKIIKKLNPDIIICHGNRAIRLALKAAKKSAPIVGVAHNYKNKSFHECDAIFCITKHLVDRMHKLGISTNKVFHVPNMVKTAENVKRPELRTPPVIGTMGRFVEKKGFDVFIDSLSILKKDGVEFKALLGGDGPLKGQLEKQIQHCALCEEIKLCGWVENKHSFFNDIDLFILPSRHEPFGIVLIEAMSHQLPCISTASEGPSEIITHDTDGVLVPIDDSKQLASHIYTILFEKPNLSKQLGGAARRTVLQKYTQSVIGKILEQHSIQIMT
ncbi:MAG: glycosyltransferase [Phycisphaerae bacterium]|nr:glycosyltransferase [Phycisphaerae bacterium]